jgi:hypothetical protein
MYAFQHTSTINNYNYEYRICLLPTTFSKETKSLFCFLFDDFVKLFLVLFVRTPLVGWAEFVVLVGV